MKLKSERQTQSRTVLVPSMTMKTCTSCLQELPITRFSVRADRGTRRSRCRRCESDDSLAYQRARHASDPEFRDLQRSQRLVREFGINAEQYDEILAAQAGACAICGSLPGKKRLAVDHDHETGRVRGLLCSDCNLALGLLGDKADGALRAVAYLTKDFGPLEAQI